MTLGRPPGNICKACLFLWFHRLKQRSRTWIVCLNCHPPRLSAARRNRCRCARSWSGSSPPTAATSASSSCSSTPWSNATGSGRRWRRRGSWRWRTTRRGSSWLDWRVLLGNKTGAKSRAQIPNHKITNFSRKSGEKKITEMTRWARNGPWSLCLFFFFLYPYSLYFFFFFLVLFYLITSKCYKTLVRIDTSQSLL